MYEIFLNFANGGLTLYDIHGYRDKKNNKGLYMLFAHMKCNLYQENKDIDIEYAKTLAFLKKYKHLILN